MNQSVPDWDMGDASRAFLADPKKPLIGHDSELIELLWCNGHVVMQSQSHRRSPRAEPAQKAAAAAAMQEEEAAPWFPSYPVDEPLDRDLFSDLFYDIPAPADAGDKPGKAAPGGGAKCGEMPSPHAASTVQHPMSLEEDDHVGDLSEFFASRKAGAGSEAPYAPAEAGESSMLTAGSSICGSNHVTARRPGASGTGHGNANGNASASAPEATAASSSGRSNCSFGRAAAAASTGNRSSKRKGRDTEESGTRTENAELESGEASKPPQRPAASRRSRAAEVHNLSERRRRDRINEKMRALQELIPHCNKTDKASMLDEAIEYLKTLQLQVQMMWMGGAGMAAPVMFPGIHHYMPQMGMPPLPPYMDSAGNRAAPSANAPGFQHHLPAGASLAEHMPYGPYLSVNPLQPPPQGMRFCQFGAKTGQQNLPAAVPSGGGGSGMPATNVGAMFAQDTQSRIPALEEG